MGEKAHQLIPKSSGHASTKDTIAPIQGNFSKRVRRLSRINRIHKRKALESEKGARHSSSVFVFISHFTKQGGEGCGRWCAGGMLPCANCRIMLQKGRIRNIATTSNTTQHHHYTTVTHHHTSPTTHPTTHHPPPHITPHTSPTTQPMHP
jgi:hypothetical protein